MIQLCPVVCVLSLIPYVVVETGVRRDLLIFYCEIKRSPLIMSAFLYGDVFSCELVYAINWGNIMRMLYEI